MDILNDPTKNQIVDCPPISPPYEDPELLGFKPRQRMEPWYNPKQLARTGLRTVVSSLFGSYADRREMQASLKEAEPYSALSQKSTDGLNQDTDEAWVDYVSDLGSGFNSTYSIAYLLSKEILIVNQDNKEQSLKRGDLLIMGGDEVYPTPSSEEYSNRLSGPYQAALPAVTTATSPKLFAIPGNHDWYDGLSAFLKLFCQGRSIGAWKTEQTRSYFAIELPHGWWIWGIDIQLSEDIDEPQKDFFATVNKSMKPDDKVLLCTAEPAWIYFNQYKESKSFLNLDYFCKRFITDPTDASLHKLRLPLILSGDLHHYSSYEHTTDKTEPSWYITAGGGGAFLHPTHQLPKKLTTTSKNVQLKTASSSVVKEYDQRAIYPSSNQSRLLLLQNLLFPIYNGRFAALMGILYLIFAWAMTSGSDRIDAKNQNLEFRIFKDIHGQAAELHTDCSLSSYIKAMAGVYAYLFIENSFLTLFVLLIGVGFYKFTDQHQKRNRGLAFLAGVTHSGSQIIILLTIIWFWADWAFIQNYNHYLPINKPWQSTVAWMSRLFVLFLIGSFISSFLMGIYLLLTNLLLGIHATEAFSALRIQGYKNFLRLHITKEALTIYPIKVTRLPRRWPPRWGYGWGWKYQAGVKDGSPWYVPEQGEVKYDLIQKPIKIV